METELNIPFTMSKKYALLILQKAVQILPIKQRTYFYWKLRAYEFGRRSVLNLAYLSDEYDTVTIKQKNEIFPVLEKNLRGDEKTCLDFGCGPGRFTPDLARLINGKAVGVDPIRKLIELAPKNDNVEYKLIQKGKIPLVNESIDLLWCCLVLGGIDDSILPDTAIEMIRVLRDEGIMILIENVSQKTSGNYWRFRSTGYYCSLFPEITLSPVHYYEDCGETIAIMIGRKRVFKQQ